MPTHRAYPTELYVPKANGAYPERIMVPFKEVKVQRSDNVGYVPILKNGRLVHVPVGTEARRDNVYRYEASVHATVPYELGPRPAPPAFAPPPKPYTTGGSCLWPTGYPAPVPANSNSENERPLLRPGGTFIAAPPPMSFDDAVAYGVAQRAAAPPPPPPVLHAHHYGPVQHFHGPPPPARHHPAITGEDIEIDMIIRQHHASEAQKHYDRLANAARFHYLGPHT